ncbi:uncharacterized protein LOC118185005 [Stegodyphus dumicola]|uniref:uncharacterized protein LOC118185005 n=1 Tax=Stegodyphus dumicola TaxID=202533 RepID=UPI0015AE4936|nr:uncharacterized protein LOC118185005 [Stegodyphus dumicola]
MYRKIKRMLHSIFTVLDSNKLENPDNSSQTSPFAADNFPNIYINNPLENIATDVEHIEFNNLKKILTSNKIKRSFCRSGGYNTRKLSPIVEENIDEEMAAQLEYSMDLNKYRISEEPPKVIEDYTKKRSTTCQLFGESKERLNIPVSPPMNDVELKRILQELTLFTKFKTGFLKT